MIIGLNYCLRHETATSSVLGFILPLLASQLPQLIHASQQHAPMLRYYLRIITIVSYVFTRHASCIKLPHACNKVNVFEAHFGSRQNMLYTGLVSSFSSHSRAPTISCCFGVLDLGHPCSNFATDILESLLFIVPAQGLRVYPKLSKHRSKRIVRSFWIFIIC